MLLVEGTNARVLASCGKLMLGDQGTFGGKTFVFDEEAGALVGMYVYSDVTWGPCCAGGYVFGQGLFAAGTPLAELPGASCPEIEACLLCGAGDSPPCF